MTKYHCISCDIDFEIKNKGKARCPKCMGIHDIEAIETKSPKGSTGEASPKKSSIVILAVLVVAAIIGGIYYNSTKKTDTSTSEKVVSSDDLASLIESLGVPKEKVVLPFKNTDDISAFAKKTAGGKKDAAALESMISALLAEKNAGKWAPYQQSDPRKEAPVTADELLKKLAAPKLEKPWHATSYEMAALLLAMGRALELDVYMARIYAFENDKRPADESGRQGRYGVVLGKSTKEGTKTITPPLFDPFSGRFGQSALGQITVLKDEEAVAPFFSLHALSLLSKRDTATAHTQNDYAIKLDPACSVFRSVRGLIFASSGALNEALIELEKAFKNQENANSRINMAEMLLIGGMDPTGKRAEAEILAALKEMPNYVRAHTLQAALHTQRREIDAAEEILKKAEKIDPKSPAVALSFAQLFAAQGLGEDAIAKAKEAVRLSNESMASLLSLAQIQRATARFDEMRETLDSLLAQTDSVALRDEIKEMFQYDPDQKEEEPEEKADAGTGSGLKLELKTDSNEQFKLGGDKQGLKLQLGSDDFKMGGAGAGGPGLGGSDNKLKLNFGDE